MPHVIFFEKVGCASNARQKAWLAEAGHVVEARDLLKHPWSRDELAAWFGALPVAEWFNRSAPQIKSGKIVPEALDREAALTAMLREPLLIRRPLLLADGRREVGFDVERIHAWLGLPEAVVTAFRRESAERCARER